MTCKTFIGIDPGWKNLGLAVLRQEQDEDRKVSLIHSAVMNPSSFKSITLFIDALDKVITPLTTNLSGVTIERFVAYNTIHTAESESINMLIGAMCYYFGSASTWNVEPNLVRAIDWKTALVKQLFKKKGFENPSDTLDKKFSIAAAKCCLDHEIQFKTDHEADGVCLSALPIFTSKGA